MGYYAYQNGLIHNHLNQEGGWDSHLASSRRFINRMMEYFKPEKVTVLGSGWLLDLPLSEMLEQKRTVILVDIIQPPEVLRQASKLENVILVEKDISGGLIEEVWNKTRGFSLFKKLKSIESIIIPEFSLDFEPGLVISLNILTQLESQLLNYLKSRSVVSNDELMLFRRRIQEKHIDFLSKHMSLIITDYAEVITKKSGEVSTIPSLLAELPKGQYSEEWTWDIEMKRSENYLSKRLIKVVSVAW
jgi:hypothetical protein